MNIKLIKEKLKRSAIIVRTYETCFRYLYSLRINVKNRYRCFVFCIHNKTHFCYGNQNRDKTFFVISEESQFSGLYTTILCMLPYIDYAIKKKWIPIVDLQRIFLPSIQDEGEAGKENPWEYYFEQPVKPYTLGEVYQSRHVIIKMDTLMMFKVEQPDWNSIFPASQKNLKYWNHIIKTYIRPNEELKDRIEAEWGRIFKSNQKILGVGIRAGLRAGAMRGGELYSNHPKQPTCEELMDLVEKRMHNWKCDILFVSSDDREYLDKFIMRFGNKCTYIADRKLAHFFKNDEPVMNVSEVMVERAGSTVREMTKEYIVETYVLSKCHCMYSCIGGGAEFAYFLNGGQYEYCEVYNQGLYEVAKSGDENKDHVSGYNC